MKKLSKDRQVFLNQGLCELPNDYVNRHIHMTGENGETLSMYDEAEVWKRVLNYRLARTVKPKIILETHAGKGVSTDLYRMASPKSNIISSQKYQDVIPIIQDNSLDFVDVDPFGMPYEAIELVKNKLKNNCVLLVSNGEMFAVTRRLNTVHLKTDYYGKESYKWVEKQYLSKLEELTGLTVQFYYIFPTTVRVILSDMKLPNDLFRGCKQYMWWIEKYVKGDGGLE